MKSIFHTGFFLFHFNLGCSTNTNHSNPACELGDTLLEFLFIVVAGGLFDLNTNLLDASFDVLGVTRPVDDGGVLFCDLNGLGLAKLLEGRLLKGHTRLFRDYGSAGKNRHIFKHGFTAIAKAGCLNGYGFKNAANVVHHQGGKGLAFDVFCNDKQRTAGLGNLLKQRKKLANVGDLLVVQENEWVLKHGNLLVGVVNKVGRQIATVKLHALNDVEFVVQRLAVFDRNDALFANLLHGLRNNFADLAVGVG